MYMYMHMTTCTVHVHLHVVVTSDVHALYINGRQWTYNQR